MFLFLVFIWRTSYSIQLLEHLPTVRFGEKYTQPCQYCVFYFFHLVKLFVASYLVKLFYHSNQFLFKDQSQSQATLDTSAFCNVFVLWQYSNSMPCNLQKKGFCFILMSVCLAWNVECLCVIGARYAFRRNIYLDVNIILCLFTYRRMFCSMCLSVALSIFHISYYCMMFLTISCCFVIINIGILF